MQAQRNPRRCIDSVRSGGKALLLSVLLLASGIACAAPPQPISLQLRWLHQFQFAGYYAAKQQGYYQEAGLDVEIVAGSPQRRSVNEVLSGRADFAVANSEVLYHRLQGRPLVALAAIFQHSASAFLVKQQSGIRSPQDFVGRRLMMINTEANIELVGVLGKEGLDPDSVEIIDSSFNINDLINDRTDIFSSYITNEPYLLSELNIPYNVISPASYGIDFYSDVLFTTEAMLEKSPDVVRAFRAASLRGWSYALQYPEEIIQLIKDEYASNKSLKHLRFEAGKTRELIMPDLIQIGHMNPGRWRHMADTFVSEGFIEPGYSLEGFLYDPYEEPDYSGWLKAIAGLLGIIVLFSAVSVFLYRFNRKLHRQIERRERAEKDSSRQKSLFVAIFNSTPDATILCDTEGTILMCNPAFTRTFGYQADEITGQTADSLCEDKECCVAQGLLQTQSANLATPISYEMNYRRKNNEVFPCEVQGCRIDRDQEVLGLLLVIRDITLQKQTQAEITRLAMTDSLTDLANRYHFEQSLQETISLAKRNDQQVSLALMDLDFFKQVNDLHGHAVGDAVLLHAASVLKKTFRQSDLIARIGGDEFAILMYAPDSPEFARVPAERVIKELSSPIIIDGHEISIGASFGVATYPTDTDNQKDLLIYADVALYDSKNRGRNCCTLYEKKQEDINQLAPE